MARGTKHTVSDHAWLSHGPLEETGGLQPGGARFRIPAATVQSEIEVKNSVFCARVAHAVDVASARAVIEDVREEHSGANHVAWAYRIGAEPTPQLVFSDDGEPGGTAGRPMLSILEGSGLQEVVAAVARYFGGRKLGRGGLVRAYGGAVRAALEGIPVSECVVRPVAEIRTDYGLYGTLAYQLPRHEVIVESEEFGAQVTLQIAVSPDRTSEVGNLLRDVSGGRIDLDQAWIGQRTYARLV
jgi:uncharacterized YigZ family protein